MDKDMHRKDITLNAASRLIPFEEAVKILSMPAKMVFSSVFPINNWDFRHHKVAMSFQK